MKYYLEYYFENSYLNEFYIYINLIILYNINSL